MTRLVLVLALVLIAPLVARAQTAEEGGLCVAPQCLDSQDGAPAQWLCKDMGSTGTKTQCGPIQLQKCPGGKYTVKINKVQAACPFPAMLVESSDQITEGAPTVWDTVGTLTGPTFPAVSLLAPDWKIGPTLRATFADVADANCTAISVVTRCVK